jgi:hypothetical protein
VGKGGAGQTRRMRSGCDNVAADPGLCGDCVHAQTIHSDRGSIFYLCRLGLTNPRFPKYPRLPVRQCDGYQPHESTQPVS